MSLHRGQFLTRSALRLSNGGNELQKTNNKAIVLRPLYRSACVSRHLQLTTGGFCWRAKFYCPHALADGNQRIQIRDKTLEFSTVLSTLSPYLAYIHTYTHTHPFIGLFSGTTQVSRYQKGRTNLDFIEARDSEWQWHQLGHIQVCIQITTPAPHHSVFYRSDALPAAQPTVSKHWRQHTYIHTRIYIAPKIVRTNLRHKLQKKLNDNNLRDITSGWVLFSLLFFVRFLLCYFFRCCALLVGTLFCCFGCSLILWFVIFVVCVY